jgi:DtxR family Mn-dependent transcriptional regulator
VTEAVARLRRDALLVEGPHQTLRLTERGHRVAADVVRRHRIVEAWAVLSLGLDWVTADEEAQRLAPVVSDAVLARMHEVIGRPACCPHGNQIPGEPAAELVARRLVDLAPGTEGWVARISELAEHDAHEILDLAERAGLVPTTPVTVAAVAPDGAMTLEVRGRSERVWPRVGSAVWVTEDPRVVRGREAGDQVAAPDPVAP